MQGKFGLAPIFAGIVDLPQINRYLKTLNALLLFASVSACATAPDDAGAIFTAPDKFEFYNCEQLETRMRNLMAREKELRALIGKASQSPVGSVIAVAAYRTEYLQTRNDLKVISEWRVTKNCSIQSGWLSDRSMW